MISNHRFTIAVLVLTFLPFTHIAKPVLGQVITQDFSEQKLGWQSDLNDALMALEQNYAYRQDSKLDWNVLRQTYFQRLKAIKNKREFFSLIENLADEPHDHHLHLNQNSQASYRLVPSGLELWTEFENGVYRIQCARDFPQLESPGPLVGGIIQKIGGIDFDESVKNRLAPFADRDSDQAKSWAARTLIAGRQSQKTIELTISNQQGATSKHTLRLGETADGPRLLSFKLPEEVQYVRIENSLGQSELISEFDKLIDAVHDAPSMILDLRNTPGGGNTHVARGIMGRLVSREMPYQRHELVEQPFSIPRIWVERVAPRGKNQFNGPIVVLIGRWTGSMGEGIAIGLNSMRQAKTIGTPMAGLKGATRRFDLPNSGIGIYIPTERLFHVDGTPRENYRPEIIVNTNEHASKGDPVLTEALRLLAGNKN